MQSAPVFKLIPLLLVLILQACNPLYVIQAGITQSEILLNRRSIPDVIEDSQTPVDYRDKLMLVTKARDFAKTIALEPKGSFQSYSALDRDILAWIVMGARPDSFDQHTWWFPIVGKVPYKGYFSPEAAECEAVKLRSKGYETLVRGTEAFSTLGWFDDPVMTPMLKDPEHEIVNTVLHEILHTTLWLPNYVAFNESLANFVGLRGAIAFFLAKKATCQDSACLDKSQYNYQQAEQSFLNALDVSRTLELLVPELGQLYKSTISKAEKLTAREQIFARHIEPLRVRIPTLKILKTAHNAELLQLQLYYSKLDLFLKLWDKHHGAWEPFISELKLLAQRVASDNKDPFLLLAYVHRGN